LLQLVEVIDLSTERLADGVNRLTDGYGADIIVNGLGGNILSEALQILAPGGSLTTLGYAAGRETTIDVTNLGASIKSFLPFSETVSARLDAWSAISKLFASGQIKPIVAKTFALEDAAQAIRYLVEDRPLGRVVLTF
jgi:NADPH:quinone reductase